MPARKLSDRQAGAMYELFLKGETARELADAYGISESTVWRYLSRCRASGGGMAKQERVVAGNKRHGRLVCTDTDGRQYKGTHLMGDGTMRSWEFTSMNQRMAIERWEKWCHDLDDEQAFMDMVERREPDAGPAPGPEAGPEAEPEPTPKADGGGELMDRPDRVYVIWVGGDSPRIYPEAFFDEDAALAKVEGMNEVAAFLGSEGAFDVEEVRCI